MRTSTILCILLMFLTSCSEQEMMDVVPFSAIILLLLAIAVAVYLSIERLKQERSCLGSLLLSGCIIGSVLLFDIYAPIWLQYLMSFVVFVIVVVLIGKYRKEN